MERPFTVALNGLGDDCSLLLVVGLSTPPHQVKDALVVLAAIEFQLFLAHLAIRLFGIYKGK